MAKILTLSILASLMMMANTDSRTQHPGFPHKTHVSGLSFIRRMAKILTLSIQASLMMMAKTDSPTQHPGFPHKTHVSGLSFLRRIAKILTLSILASLISIARTRTLSTSEDTKQHERATQSTMSWLSSSDANVFFQRACRASAE